jgi:hypothetical protein
MHNKISLTGAHSLSERVQLLKEIVKEKLAKESLDMLDG